MKDLLTKWNVNQLTVEGHEADDIIGTYARKLETETDANIKIISRDKDLIQLITERVSVWQNLPNLEKTYKQAGLTIGEQQVPRGYFEHNSETWKHFYPGLTDPKQIIDLKALEGDRSDNIPGVRGVGEATALNLVSEFTSYEKLMEFAQEKSKKKFDDYCKEKELFNRSPYNALHKYRKDGEMSYRLATIQTELEKLKNKNASTISFDPNNEKKLEVFEELKFNL